MTAISPAGSRWSPSGGKALDPIADKITQVLALMLMMRVAPARALFAILLIKESAMGVANLLLMPSGNRLDGAMWFGKVSTAALYVGLVALIALPQMPPWTQTLLVAVCSALLLLSAALYVPVFAHNLNRRASSPPRAEERAMIRSKPERLGRPTASPGG